MRRGVCKRGSTVCTTALADLDYMHMQALFPDLPTIQFFSLTVWRPDTCLSRSSKMIHVSSWGEPERAMQKFADLMFCHGKQTVCAP